MAAPLAVSLALPYSSTSRSTVPLTVRSAVSLTCMLQDTSPPKRITAALPPAVKTVLPALWPLRSSVNLPPLMLTSSAAS